jgi:integrase
MRIRESYSLYKRVMKSGKVIWYYQCYDADGLRTTGHSTGESTKTLAREHCNRLMKAGKLIPLGTPGGRCPRMEEFGADFWDYDKSEYLISRKGRGPITRSYARTNQGRFKNHILPQFGKKRLDTIKTEEIDYWLTHYEEWGVSRGMANHCFKCLKTMLNWAVFKKLIPVNPCNGLQKLLVPPKKVEVLTIDEVRRLFPRDYITVWNFELYYILYKLAFCSGMRISELLGLRGCCVLDNHILVEAQYNKDGLVDTKSHRSRNIPLPKGMIADLRHMQELNPLGMGYLFSKTNGTLPVSYTAAVKHLRRALERIGISREEQKRRNLTNHSFRYFLNTLLIDRNVEVKKIQAVIGHCREKETDTYTSVDALHFGEVLQAQEELMKLQGPEASIIQTAEPEGAGLPITQEQPIAQEAVTA